MKPSIYCLSIPWIFFGLAFFLVGLPSLHSSLHPAQRALTTVATWCYAVASAAAFLFFGLNFGEEAVRVLPGYLLCLLTFFPGCCHRGLDDESLHCPGHSTDLGCCPLVLG
jgi:hypothetical protein